MMEKEPFHPPTFQPISAPHDYIKYVISTNFFYCKKFLHLPLAWASLLCQFHFFFLLDNGNSIFISIKIVLAAIFTNYVLSVSLFWLSFNTGQSYLSSSFFQHQYASFNNYYYYATIANQLRGNANVIQRNRKKTFP